MHFPFRQRFVMFIFFLVLRANAFNRCYVTKNDYITIQLKELQSDVSQLQSSAFWINSFVFLG